MKKKIKNLTERIRKWIIKRLGGYTEQRKPVFHAYHLPVKDYHCVRKLSEYEEDYFYKKYSPEGVTEYVKEALYYKAAREILPEICDIKQYRDPFTRCMTFELCFYAVPKNEIEIEITERHRPRTGYGPDKPFSLDEESIHRLSRQAKELIANDNHRKNKCIWI